MKVIDTPLQGLKVIEPTVFKDERGYFFESFSEQKFIEAGINVNFVQDNQSLSQKAVLRGLHFQAPPYAQGKLVRVIQGAVIDVAVDIRKNSPTYGQHFTCELSAENFKMLWVPPGFAHGFATLEDNTIFFYKCTEFYNKESEGAILWKDESLGIDWQIQSPIISDKDKVAQSFAQFESPFN